MTDSTPHDLSRVLIVDDNLALAENIAEILELEGFFSDVVGTGEDALPRALDSNVAIVVTDYRLPGIDGIELIRRVRRAREQVRCVLISAYADEKTASSAEDAGASFLPKPLDPAQLVQHIRRAFPWADSLPR